MSPERIASVPGQPGAALGSNEMAEERLTFLNLRAVSRSHLFEAARSLIGNEEPRGPALVVAGRPTGGGSLSSASATAAFRST
jgi:hypothetical protein